MTTRTPKAGKGALIEAHRQSDNDTGSADVQVAILTQRITELTDHLKVHKKDNHSRLGLMKLVGRRSKLLRYIQKQDPERYQALIAKLGIRGVRTVA